MAMQRLISTIEGSRGQFRSLSDSVFTHIEPFDPELAITKPDQYDGASFGAIDHRVLKHLDKRIIPSTNLSRPAAPNFFLEGKSELGRSDVAQRQAAHNGAVGARAMMSLQSYPEQTLQYDDRAYSFTNTYHDGTLKMYTTHATAPKSDDDDHQPQDYMTQLRTFAMTDSGKTFREGATHYRNARDLAKEQRDSFIQQANQAAQQMPSSKHSNRSTSTTTNTKSALRISSYDAENETSSETDTSTDELALEKTFRSSRNATLVDDGEDDTGRTGFKTRPSALSQVAPPSGPTRTAQIRAETRSRNQQAKNRHG